MSILPNLLRSLLITSVFSFLVPMIGVGIILAMLALLGYIPDLTMLSNTGIEQVLHFLSVFGSGNSLHGLLTICTTGSVVGILFDAYTFYRYQNLRD